MTDHPQHLSLVMPLGALLTKCAVCLNEWHDLRQVTFLEAWMIIVDLLALLVTTAFFSSMSRRTTAATLSPPFTITSEMRVQGGVRKRAMHG